MSQYSLRLVHDFAQAIKPALHDDELPKLRTDGEKIGPDERCAVVRPGSTYVFLNPADRMIVLRGDEYRPDLCRKINQTRYGPRYRYASEMGSENSEDATTWSFFRALEKRCRPEWVLHVLRKASGADVEGPVDGLSVRYWFGRITDERLPVSPGMPWDETHTEMDALVEFYVAGQPHLIAVEAKVGSSFSGSGARDQFARVIDIGSYYAATKCIPPSRFWAVAVLPAEWRRNQGNPHEVPNRYKDNPKALGDALAHRVRSEGDPGDLREHDLAEIGAHVGAVTWEDLIEIGRMTRQAERRDQVGPWP